MNCQPGCFFVVCSCLNNSQSIPLNTVHKDIGFRSYHIGRTCFLPLSCSQLRESNGIDPWRMVDLFFLTCVVNWSTSSSRSLIVSDSKPNRQCLTETFNKTEVAFTVIPFMYRQGMLLHNFADCRNFHCPKVGFICSGEVRLLTVISSFFAYRVYKCTLYSFFWCWKDPTN